MPQNTGARRQGGFTLIEILVALILIALLLGAVVPAVLNQVNKGDTNRILEDLDAVTAGIQTFRMDVKRWPGDLEDLIFQPTAASSTADADIDGTAYSAGMVAKWDGAYLDGVSLDENDALVTGGEGMIQNDFDVGGAFALNGEDYITITVNGLALSQVEAVDVAMDGSATSSTGRVHTSGTTLYFLATPKR
jgi:prepilin-type N-terminal cleavage/methylation domain-containing protein